MSLIEIILISVGLSLDVYAVVVCQGCLLMKVEKNKLLKLCGLFCAWQVAAVLLGSLISFIPYLSVKQEQMRYIWELVSVIIVLFLGGYMVLKAWQNKAVYEHRSDIDYRAVCVTCFFTCLDAFFAGMAFGFMGARLLIVFLCMLIVTVVVVIIGIYTGYRIGYEHKRRAYIIGALLLIFSAAEMIARYIA